MVLLGPQGDPPEDAQRTKEAEIVQRRAFAFVEQAGELEGEARIAAWERALRRDSTAARNRMHDGLRELPRTRTRPNATPQRRFLRALIVLRRLRERQGATLTLLGLRVAKSGADCDEVVVAVARKPREK